MDGPTRLHREGSRQTRPSSSQYMPTSSFESASTRFTNDSLSFLNKLKERLPEHLQPFFWLGLWFGSAVLIIGLVVGFHSKIFSALQALADFIKGLGPLGPPVIMICLFATSFPPVIGYSSIVTMSGNVGYVYGFMFGFLIAFTGALAGAIVCFYFCRRWFKAQVRKLMAKNRSLKGVVRTVEKRGFRLLVLIRLAPYPYNVINAILSATHIPLSTFTAATAISLIKLTLHVYIGSTLSTLTGGDGDDTDPEKDPNNHGKRVKVFIMVMGIILGVGVGAYVWAVAKREIAITEAARMERRRRRRGGRRGRSAAFDRDSGGSGGIELSEQQEHIPGVDLTSRDSVDGFFSGAATGRGERTGQDLSDANYFVGGAGNESRRYQDYEDDGDHESNTLFGAGGGGRRPQQQHQGQRGDWRNVGGAGVGTDSLSNSDESDYFDDDSDDDDDGEYEDGVGGERSDLERGFGLGLELGSERDGAVDRNRTNGFGDEFGGFREEEALDFSAHHAGLSDSPWRDDDNIDEENGSSHDLLGGDNGGRALSERGTAHRTIRSLSTPISVRFITQATARGRNYCPSANSTNNDDGSASAPPRIIHKSLRAQTFGKKMKLRFTVPSLRSRRGWPEEDDKELF
ncbi:hypothetical protein BGZ95_008450 [Linnemannia exigua]|uniref:Golgi apparatus membrane protein TVP38 n=1 Tax=Linnemannia exigua TaxID=604196 RepID=A0AAD4H7R6_9FUNG|nr:hypothetical protein BGZ95_008450 [Linnemannia exigua]